jgi:hypothetical protein
MNNITNGIRREDGCRYKRRKIGRISYQSFTVTFFPK